MHEDPRKDYSRLNLNFGSPRLIPLVAEPDNKFTEYRIEVEIAKQKRQSVLVTFTTRWTYQATISAEHISSKETCRLCPRHDDHGYGDSFSAKDQQEP